MKSVAGFDLASERDRGKPPAIRLRLDPSLATSLGPEGYRLAVRKEGVNLEVAHSRGLIYGVQTLRQLLPVNYRSRDCQDRRSSGACPVSPSKTSRASPGAG